MFVKKDAKILYFCSRKCEKNMLELKRKARQTTWTEEARAAKKQTMAASSKDESPAPAKPETKKGTKKSAKKAAEPAE